MVSTVTSTTVTTVTLFGITALLGLAAVLMLIGYLVAKEMLSASSNRWLQLVGRRLNVAIVPLPLGWGPTPPLFPRYAPRQSPMPRRAAMADSVSPGHTVYVRPGGVGPLELP